MALCYDLPVYKDCTRIRTTGEWYVGTL